MPNPPSPRRRAALHHALGDMHRLAVVDALQLSDRTPSELCTLTGTTSNLLAHHLEVLEAAGVIRRERSQGDGRRRYVRLQPESLHELWWHDGTLVADELLFVCTHNAARSQLAAGLWERRTGRPARSAGHRPAAEVHPLARTVAAARGIDLAAAPASYDTIDRVPDLVVSVCDRANEAGLPFDAPMLHWSIPDPSSGGQAAFEAVADELATRIDLLAACTVSSR